MRGVTVMAQAGADAGDLVGGHGSADAAAANQNAAFTLAAQQAERNRFSEVRVIDRLGAVGTGVVDLMPPEPQMIGQDLLQVVAGMIGTDGDAHVYFFLPANNSLAAVTTASEVKPKCFITSLTGADAPNVLMPMLLPAGPTHCDQPMVAAASTEMRAVTAAGKT